MSCKTQTESSREQQVCQALRPTNISIIWGTKFNRFNLTMSCKQKTEDKQQQTAAGVSCVAGHHYVNYPRHHVEQDDADRAAGRTMSCRKRRQKPQACQVPKATTLNSS
jgi:hypothetical protein